MEPQGLETERLFRCPACDAVIGVPVDLVGRAVACPACGDECSTAPGGDEITDDRPAAGPDLSGVRIRQLSALRLATLRVRSWWMIGMLLAGVTAVDLLARAVGLARAGAGWATLLAAGATAAAAAALACGRAARRLGREVARSSLPQPSGPPDFSTLSNGEDRWRHLEDIR